MSCAARSIVLAMLLTGWGCKESEPEPSMPDAAATVDAAVDAGVVADAAVDAGIEPNRCDDLGLRRMPLLPGDSTFGFGDVAGSFSLTELSSATFSLADTWTGCDSFVFVMYIPTTSPAPKYEDRFWNASPLPLIENTPPNTHIFFLSMERYEADRRARMEEMQSRVDGLLGGVEDDRFHYVITHPNDIEGSVSAFIQDYFAFQADRDNFADLGNRGMAPPPLPFVFAIDRDQRWDSGGSLDEFVGGAPTLALASWLPAFFAHKASIRDQQATETGVDTFLLLDETVTERIFERDVELPGASQMAAYDTMEFDVAVQCRERNVFNCSEWDRIARIQLCTNADCSERQEVVRWITPYWRRGSRRWVMDASSLLGLVADGGARRFRIEMGPSWERATPRDAKMTLRLSNQGGGARATGAEPAFSGGSFDDTYNDRMPVAFTPPATASKVELVVILSGHGQADGNNCAEWCDHRHYFTVNGSDLDVIRHEGAVGSAAGCAPAAAQGVPPGQYGNWAPERAYWCPGLPVTPIRIDITNLVTTGQSNELTYRATLRANGMPNGGNISLSSYVVWYE